jgi:F-type H+-transporting ATPase subunit a
LNPAVLAAFEPPTTKDFVYRCWGPGLNVAGVELCFTFITFLVVLGILVFVAFFYLSLRNPKVVPGRMQTIAESGISFVRENIAIQMIGPEGDRFMPLLCTLFFSIFIWNAFEIVPGLNFSSNSRLAVPLVMAIISWVTYNTVGIQKHGIGGYLKLMAIPVGAPLWLYPLLVPIEFISNILIRPVTLTIRLWANFLAGHFLLAVFFLGTIAMLQGGFTIIFAPFSFAMSITMVAFELFVAALQAFIFAILTASYIGGALAEEH